MKIFTSYYAKFRAIDPNFILVQISTSKPSWFELCEAALPELYPGWGLVNGIKGGTITKKEYEEIYKKRLANIDKHKILSELQELSNILGGRDIALLCYEKPGDFCHRHFVGEWLGIEELDLNKYYSDKMKKENV